jgi:hypothetical protein
MLPGVETEAVKLTKPQFAILADLAEDDYGLWEIPWMLGGPTSIGDDPARTVAQQALAGLLEADWVRFYVTDEPHGERPQVLTKEHALSLMDENAPWVADVP